MLWLILLVTSIIGLITYVLHFLNYWNNKNLPNLPFELPSKSVWIGEKVAEYYNVAKEAGHKHVGLFYLWVPTYIPLDLSIIKNILTKDFHSFSDRGMYYNEKVDPLSAHLFVLEEKKWKNLRRKLTPTFTSGKMKMMFETVLQIGNNLKDEVDKLCLSEEPIEIKNLLQHYTTDVIGSCAFGLDCNSFKNPNSDFRTYGKKLLGEANWAVLKSFVGFSSPSFANLIGLRIQPKCITEFFFNVIKQTTDYRDINNVTRNDLLQLLLNLRNGTDNVKGEDGLTIHEIASQAYLFFVAGFETSSGTMTLCLYELACNRDIQERVRDEVNHLLENSSGEITYDLIMKMKYMGRVVDETLRKYPILPILTRNCVETYRIPDTNIVLDKRTLVMIPVYGLHHDPEHFPDPEKFDPERFNDINKEKIKPFSYLPFGEGPRNCIGLRFGLMQIKVGLALLLKHFTFSLNAKTKIPLEIDPQYFFATALGNIWLDVEKLDNKV